MKKVVSLEQLLGVFFTHPCYAILNGTSKIPHVLLYEGGGKKVRRSFSTFFFMPYRIQNQVNTMNCLQVLRNAILIIVIMFMYFYYKISHSYILGEVVHIRNYLPSEIIVNFIIYNNIILLEETEAEGELT